MIQKLSIYYKYSELNRTLLADNGNIQLHIDNVPLYSNSTFLKKIGKAVIEQYYNIKTKETKTTFNLHLDEGVITFVVINCTIDGKGATNTTMIGPVIYGTKRYLFWTSNTYFSRIKYIDNNIRHITILKK